MIRLLIFNNLREENNQVVRFWDGKGCTIRNGILADISDVASNDSFGQKLSFGTVLVNDGLASPYLSFFGFRLDP